MYDFEDGTARQVKKLWLWKVQFAQRAKHDLVIASTCLFIIGLLIGFCCGIYFWEYRL